MRSYACASSCIKAAMQVIWIVRQLHQRGYAVAPYWLTLFMTLFSAMTLVMFALSNEGGATVDEAWEAINTAVWLFTELSSTSFIAQRCASILEVCYGQLTQPQEQRSAKGIWGRSLRQKRLHCEHIQRLKTAFQPGTFGVSSRRSLTPAKTTQGPRRAVTLPQCPAGQITCPISLQLASALPRIY